LRPGIDRTSVWRPHQTILSRLFRTQFGANAFVLPEVANSADGVCDIWQLGNAANSADSSRSQSLRGALDHRDTRSPPLCRAAHRRVRGLPPVTGTMWRTSAATREIVRLPRRGRIRASRSEKEIKRSD